MESKEIRMSLMKQTLRGAYRRAAFLSALFVLCQVVMEVLIPTKVADLVDKGLVQEDLSYMLRMGAVLLLLALLAMSFGIISGTMAAKASTGFGANLRTVLYQQIQQFSFGNVDHFSTSSLITRLTTDVNRIQFTFQMAIRMLVRAPFMFVVAISFAFRANSMIATRIMGMLPLMILIMAIIVYFAQPWVKKTLAGYDQVNLVVQENIQGMEVVKVFTREDKEQEKFNQASDSLYKAYVKLQKLNALAMPGMRIAIFLSIGVTLYLSSYAIVDGTMTTGQLMSFMTYIFQILMSVMMLTMVLIMMIMSKASYDRLVEVMKEKPMVQEIPESVQMMKDGSVDFEHVNFAFGEDPDHKALTDIDFHIEAGSTVAIVGGTGSGKTTLVQLIPRLYDVSDGQIFVGGINVRDYDLKTLRHGVSMVLQNNQLFQGTVASNLCWGDEEATEEDMWWALRLAQAEDFIEAKSGGLDMPVEQGGANFSGGQKQRLTIARALLRKPKILILDDATSALDRETERRLQEAIDENLGLMTKIIIAQRTSSIAHADAIIVLDGGKVVSMGTHEELLAECPIYSEIHASQQGGLVQ